MSKLVCPNDFHEENCPFFVFEKKTGYGPTIGRTDRRTNGPTDGRTDGPSYRDSWTNLKREGEGEEGQCVVLTNVVGEDLVRGSGGGGKKRQTREKEEDGWMDRRTGRPSFMRGRIWTVVEFF